MWRAKLKRFETWDRVFVALNVAMYLYAIVSVIAYFAGGTPTSGIVKQSRGVQEPSASFVIGVCLLFAYLLFAQAVSLWAIWRHQRYGFIIQFVLACASILGAILLPSAKDNADSFWSWLPLSITVIYCGIRTYQLRPKPAPPPLPES